MMAVRPTPTALRPERLDSVDLLRGAVMILMALDHVRDFMSDRLFFDATDLNTTSPATFLTRWITHFCAPTFIFLAGTAAFLSRTRGKSKSALSWFLLTRGLWLAVLEVTINRTLWMFNYDLHHHGAGVFWAIGWSMVVLAALIHLPPAIVTAIGVTMIGLHNTLDGLTAADIGLPGWLWLILHQPGEATVVEGFTFGTGYCLIPWAGVMAAGYGFGALLLLERSVRRRWMFCLGGFMILAFVGLRAANVYGDPRPWVEQGATGWTALSFLNCTKYPPSLLYLLMTLGPAICALAVFDRPAGPLARRVITFGRVPLFFYLLHVLLIHGGAVLIDDARFGWSPLATAGPWEIRPSEIPVNYGIGLLQVYGIWIAVILILYLPCRWFAGVKRRRRDVWLSYL